jgi:hypothetical protein
MNRRVIMIWWLVLVAVVLLLAAPRGLTAYRSIEGCSGVGESTFGPGPTSTYRFDYCDEARGKAVNLLMPFGLALGVISLVAVGGLLTITKPE